MATPQATQDPRERVLAEIARRMGIPTLETRKRDALDFYDIAVWTLKEGLERAWAAGQRAAAEPAAPAPAGDPCPGCGAANHDRLVWDYLGEPLACRECGMRFEPAPLPAALAVCRHLSDYAHNAYDEVPDDLALIVTEARSALEAAAVGEGPQ